MNRRLLAFTAVAVLACTRVALAQGDPPPDPPKDGDKKGDEKKDEKKDEGGEDTSAADDEGALEAEENPSRPPSKGKGVIWGVVKSSATKESLVEAPVQVVTGLPTGKKKSALTDVDGRYRLELPPGTYELRSYYELHKARRVQNVVVVADKVQRVDISLDPDSKSEEVVEAVVADIERGSVATQLDIRKKATVSSDSVGAADIAKTPDRNAADTAKRIVGTTVVGGRFVYVRGLGDRYTNAMLDDVPLSSPEPDRAAVPLDMFPTLIISDVTVLKSFAPDMPGDMTGGSVRIHTRDLPTKFTFQANLGVGFNTSTTFNGRPTYAGGGLDWLGVDDGTRALPKSIPTTRVTRIVCDINDQNCELNPNLKQQGKDMLRSWNYSDRTVSLPNGTGSFVLGDSIPLGKLGNYGVLGYQATAGYTRRFQRVASELVNTYDVEQVKGEGLHLRNSYTGERGIDLVQWSVLGKVSYAKGKDHKINLLGMWATNSENETRTYDGIDESSQGAQQARMRFQSRQLLFAQLQGEHRIDTKMDGTLTWSTNVARASADEPATRTVIYSTAATPRAWSDNSLSPWQFYGKQRETTYGLAVNWNQPLVKGDAPTSVKFGGFAQFKRRSFSARRFDYVGSSALNVQQEPDALFTPANVDSGAIEISEDTNGTDAYSAAQDVVAGYAMSDVSFSKKLRAILGMRLEYSRISIDSFDQFIAGQTINSALQRIDPLPALHLVYHGTPNSNVRFSITRTVARPQLREFAPFLWTDFSGARDAVGNPQLDRSTVLNSELRFELFPGMNEVAAVTTFIKSFQKPIESTIKNTSAGQDTWQNAKGAVNAGIELEGRKGLGFIHPVMKDFGLMANATFVYSRAQLAEQTGTGQTEGVRPMQGQSPYVFNIAADYINDKTKTRIRLSFNVIGPRIATVGFLGLPDIYEQPRPQMDFTIAQGLSKHFDIKLALDNILFTPYRFTQGGKTTWEYNLGMTGWLTLSYTL